jgi:hypothetical protein
MNSKMTVFAVLFIVLAVLVLGTFRGRIRDAGQLVPPLAQ